ncbi:MAG TPA: ABC transporter ATP-binding protein [Egibacteraceae bacterium]|nr:ABC transporter ATP-binding protein [Egibacteraceae bacterium]
MSEPLLEVADLRIRFHTRRGVASVVNGVTWSVRPGETVAIVGESGSGKSVSTLAILGLVPQPPGEVSGSVRFEGRELVGASDADLRRMRGNDIAMVFQDPMTSLNPVLTVGRQITEALELHLGLRGDAARRRAAELLDQVGIPSPDRRLDSYPHQMSGGMRQRVMIAIALACDPKVLIADEPTTALDVTIQAQIVELIDGLQAERGMGVVWITHDLGVVAGLADRVLVMYGGQVVEEAPVSRLYASPAHPYTQGLLAALPVLGEHRDELQTIAGLPPDPSDLPPGCLFWPRCPKRLDARCQTERPVLRPAGPDHRVATFYDAGSEVASGA